MANEAMQAAWDGDEGRHWAEYADRYNAAAARLDDAYLEAMPLTETSAVLDIGCGAGALTLHVAERVASVLAVDLSSQMLAVAAKRAAGRGLTNVEFQRADAQVYGFAANHFDLAISAMGVMFFDDPVAAFANIASALKPGGRICFAAWRSLQENEWLMAIRGALALGRELPVPPLEAPTPFSLSDPERTRSLLESAGLRDVALTPLDEPMVPGKDRDDAFGFVSQIGIVKGLTEPLDDDQKATAFDNLREMLATYETPDGVLVNTAAWIITARKDS